MLIAKDAQEEDSLTSPWREEIAWPKGQVGIACLADVYCGGDSTQEYAKMNLGALITWNFKHYRIC